MGNLLSSSQEEKPARVIRVVGDLPVKPIEFKGEVRALVTIAPTLYAREPKERAADLGRELCDVLGSAGNDHRGVDHIERRVFLPGEKGQARTILSKLKDIGQGHGSKDVDGDLLVFYFVGAAVTVPTAYGRRKGTNKAMLALNFEHDADDVMDTSEMVKALKGAKAKDIVIIAECSGNADAFLAAFSNELEQGMKKTKYDVSLVVVIATGESEIFYEEMGSGLFTYFFKEILPSCLSSRELDVRMIDIRGVVEESAERCCDITSLVYYCEEREGTAASGSATASSAAHVRDTHWAIKQLRKFGSTAKDDGTDAPDTGSASRFGFIYCHLMWPIVPCHEIELWLKDIALPSLKSLYSKSHLHPSKPRLYNAVIATLAHSCAKAVHFHQEVDEGNSNLFLLLIVRIGQMFDSFAPELCDHMKTTHVNLALGHYIITLLQQMGCLPSQESEAHENLDTLTENHLPRLRELRYELCKAVDEADAKTGKDKRDGRLGEDRWKLPRGCFPRL